MQITYVLMGPAPKCRAIGCSRKTSAPHGYCFQHADMRLHPKFSHPKEKP